VESKQNIEQYRAISSNIEQFKIPVLLLLATEKKITTSAGTD
jgi:hypothetical protein